MTVDSQRAGPCWAHLCESRHRAAPACLESGERVRPEMRQQLTAAPWPRCCCVPFGG